MITPSFTDDQITIPVADAETFEDLARTIVHSPQNMATHVITIGAVMLKGSWAVTRTHKDSTGNQEVTLTRVEFGSA